MDKTDIAKILATAVFNRLLAYVAGALAPVGINFAYNDHTSAALATIAVSVGLGIWHWFKSKANLKKALNVSPNVISVPTVDLTLTNLPSARPTPTQSSNP